MPAPSLAPFAKVAEDIAGHMAASPDKLDKTIKQLKKTDVSAHP